MRMKRLFKFIILALFLVAIVYFTRSPSYPNDFVVTDITSNILFSDKQNFSGAMSVNLDEDEEQELFISGNASKNLLLKRDGITFRSMDIPELSDQHGLAFSATACDLDQDGRDEILLINHPDPTTKDSHSRIFKFIHGKWRDLLIQNEQIIDLLSTGYSATCIDRKGDGKYGLAITKADGKISYLEMVDSKITDIANEIGIDLSSKGRSILGVPGPQGYTNIYVGNEKGQNFYFVNKGDGTFSDQATEMGLEDPLFDARGISLIDLNYDDMPDVVYGNHFGPTRLLEQKRDGSFKDITPEEMKKSYAVNATVVGDFNLDGYEDVYLNNIRGDNKVFARTETDWFELPIDTWAEKEMFGISSIAGDLDKNGSYEILNTHGDGTHFPITLYTIKPVHKWIKFHIQYANGGIPRGAIVRIRTDKRDHVRVISTGSGRFANYDSEIIFGLLVHENVLSAEVILPSGKKIEFKQKLEPMASHRLILQ